LGLGIIPCLVAVYFRVTLPETPRYTLQVVGNVSQATGDVEKVSKVSLDSSESAGEDEMDPEVKKASWADFKAYFSQWQNMRILIGTSMCWFCLDIAFYGLSLNQSAILKTIGYVHATAPAHQQLWETAVGNCVISLMGTVPGYWLAVALIEKMGRIRMQLMGFAVLTVVFIILAAGYTPIKTEATWLFIVLYCIGLFFFNFGPNTTTFIIPGEVFPTRYRSTGHGIAAGAGKLGAIVSTYGFTPVSTFNNGFRNVLAIFSVVMFIGLCFTFLLEETQGRTLEDISIEDGKPRESYWTTTRRRLTSSRQLKD